ncbi:DMT family transporter [Ostreiculturibacter nitratireducens]|uniref:DMT family transporter n=1 Tax=Ostreiculturibacter nitratireducens TaxID=3075226 RepID=UPI0031B5A699
MERRDRIDAFGAVSLTGFALLLAVNQVVIKLVNAGLQPVFFAGLRSLFGMLCLWAWLVLRGKSPRLRREMLGPGILIGVVFAAEFVFLFLALDMTTVTRTSIIFYSMPVWLSLAAHMLIPGERISGIKAVGLALAFAGVAWAILDRGGASGEASLLGDLFALFAAFGWMGVALCVRATPLIREKPETQLFWQLAVSAPVLLALSPLFGPLIRDLQPIHLAGLAFQSAVIVSAAFLFWFWLLTIYPASGVASFSFLTPVFGVALGALWLGEKIGPEIIGAASLVALGLILINRPARACRA